MYKEGRGFHAPHLLSAEWSSRGEQSIVSLRFSHVQGYLMTMEPNNAVFTVEDTEFQILVKA